MGWEEEDWVGVVSIERVRRVPGSVGTIYSPRREEDGLRRSGPSGPGLIFPSSTVTGVDLVCKILGCETR